MGMARRIRNRPPIAFAYVRVSTKGQTDGESVEDQERATIEAARAMGYEVEVSGDPGKSGRKMSNRPELLAILDKLSRGEGSALVVTDVSRLGRNTEEALRVLNTAQREGWRLVVLTIDGDTDTVEGRTAFTIWAMWADMQSRIQSKRISEWHAAKRAKAAEGVPGQTWGVDAGPRPVLPDEVRRRIRDERTAGRSLAAIADGLNLDEVPTAKGGARWYPSTVRAVLASPAMAALEG